MEPLLPPISVLVKGVTDEVIVRRILEYFDNVIFQRAITLSLSKGDCERVSRSQRRKIHPSTSSG